MNVGTLIQLLQKMPPQAEVFHVHPRGLDDEMHFEPVDIAQLRNTDDIEYPEMRGKVVLW